MDPKTSNIKGLPYVSRKQNCSQKLKLISELTENSDPKYFIAYWIRAKKHAAY